jgi:hypothetical protein
MACIEAILTIPYVQRRIFAAARGRCALSPRGCRHTLLQWSRRSGCARGGSGRAGFTPRILKKAGRCGWADVCRLQGKKLATIRRYLSTIALAHRVATPNKLKIRTISLDRRQATAREYRVFQQYRPEPAGGERQVSGKLIRCGAFLPEDFW